MKACKQCKELKNEQEFYQHPKTNKFDCRCKPCRNAFNRELREGKRAPLRDFGTTKASIKYGYAKVATTKIEGGVEQKFKEFMEAVKEEASRASQNEINKLTTACNLLRQQRDELATKLAEKQEQPFLKKFFNFTQQ